MRALPIDEVLQQATDALRAHRSLVLVAPPGAGKTTRVPPAIIKAGLLPREHPRLVMLQPRRVAARAVAERIASEQGWTLGREVGYHVRFERRLTDATRLRVLTEGILTRQLLDDPLLEGVGCVVLDEFHERNLNTDLAVALLKEVREARPDLLLVVMSATLDAEPVARYLGDSGGAPIVRSEGRTFPIAVTHRATDAAPWDAAADAVRDILEADDTGDVLVFLPGAYEIRRTLDTLRPLAAAHGLALLPLHGSLPFDEQARALQPDANGRRKVICATNIAETSLTIEGVTAVVDTGVARQASFDPQRGLDRLDLRPISKASATQRAGRAGRVRLGRCVRLFSEKDFHGRPAFDAPEVARVDLASTVLQLHAWGRRDIQGFAWYEPPPDDRLASAERLLAMLGALGDDGRITDLGRRMLALPVHPRLARMLLAAADAGLAPLGATLAALLSERDIVPFGTTAATRHDSDLLLRAEMLDDRRAAVDGEAARQVRRVRDELLRHVESPRSATITLDPLMLPLLAYPDRVCRRRPNDPAAAAMATGGGVRLAPHSAVRDGEFFVALDARRDERNTKAEALVTMASRIEEAWLELLFPRSVREERFAVYDESRERVVGRFRRVYRDLVLQESDTGSAAPADAAAALRDALVPRAADVVARSDAAAGLLRRVAFLQAVVPERATFGALDPAALVAEACGGAKGLDDVVANLRHAVDAALPYDARRLLDDLAPEAIAVPTGNRVTLDWSAAATSPQLRGPVLAVRLQEMFGLPDTPRVAAGRVPVTLHLLGPNFRPVQVTSDLASFWKNTYPQVRKDLRVRYPRHAWPDDPLAAAPEAKGSRRRAL